MWPRLYSSREPHPMHAPRILIADDQADVIEALRLLLKSEGHAIVARPRCAAAVLVASLHLEAYQTQD